jgi:hypothetical protein
MRDLHDMGELAIAVDTRNELVGDVENAGKEWQSSGQHDISGDSLGKAVPYGVQDTIAAPCGRRRGLMDSNRLDNRDTWRSR